MSPDVKTFEGYPIRCINGMPSGECSSAATTADEAVMSRSSETISNDPFHVCGKNKFRFDRPCQIRVLNDYRKEINTKLLLFMGAGVSSWGSEGIDLKRTEKANSYHLELLIKIS
jgi:hypothetical protein